MHDAIGLPLWLRRRAFWRRKDVVPFKMLYSYLVITSIYNNVMIQNLNSRSQPRCKRAERLHFLAPSALRSLAR